MFLLVLPASVREGKGQEQFYLPNCFMDCLLSSFSNQTCYVVDKCEGLIHSLHASSQSLGSSVHLEYSAVSCEQHGTVLFYEDIWVFFFNNEIIY